MNHSTPTPLHINVHPRILLKREVKGTVWAFTCGQCWYCGSYFNPYLDLCIDHVIPLCRGGSNEIENLVPCCAYCNSAKGTRLVQEWRINFTTIPQDEEPWIHESGVFWYERDDGFFIRRRENEIRAYRRSLALERLRFS